MKFILCSICIVLIMPVFSQTNDLSLKKYYERFHKMHESKFEGFRFLSDSITDPKEILTICEELGFDLKKCSFIYPKVDSINGYIGSNFRIISFSEFYKVAPYDTSIVISGKEHESFLEFMRIDDLFRKNVIDTGTFRIKSDSLINSADFKAYQEKTAKRKKIFLIFYPIVQYRDKIVIACRFYHTSRTSDAGSIFYEVFPRKEKSRRKSKS